MPELGAFHIVLVIGLILVTSSSWGKFGEPIYPKQHKKRFYSKFKPKHVTTRSKYYLAQSMYVGTMVVLYLALSSTPDLAQGLLGLKIEDKTLYPLAVAGVLMGVQNAPYVKKLEEVCRGALHSWAKIPQGVAKTIEALRHSDFDTSKYLELPDMQNQAWEFRTVKEKYFDEERGSLLNNWARACCTLYNLRRCRAGGATPGGFDNSCYDGEFFNEYEAEYKDVTTQHRNLERLFADLQQQEGLGSSTAGRAGVLPAVAQELNELLEKIYSLVACAVRSKQVNEGKVVLALKKLGFMVREPLPSAIDLATLVFAAFGLFLVFPLVAIAAPLLFDQFTDRGVDLAAHLRYLPLEADKSVLWALSTILVHVGAAWMALAYRARKVRANAWHALGKPERPYEKYFIAAVVVGGGTGYIIMAAMTSVYVFFILGPAPASEMAQTVLLKNSLVWSPLPMITAWFAVYYRDAKVFQTTFLKALSWMLLQGGLMALAAYFLGTVYTTVNSPDPTDLAGLDIGAIEFRFQILIAALSLLIGLFLGWLFPYRRRRRFRNSFAGDWRVKTAHAPPSYVTLAADGAAARWLEGTTAKEQGKWSQVDSKVRVKWDQSDPELAQFVDENYDRLRLSSEVGFSEEKIATRYQDPSRVQL